MTIGLAVVVGITLGLLGGGGSILTVPLLAYVAGMDAKQAIATSLLVVGVISVVGAISHARAGRVRWRTGLVFGVAAMAGAYAGGLLARFIPATVLLIGFAMITMVTAIAMLRGRNNIDAVGGHQRLPVTKIVLEGLAVGLVTGLVGAGGGFLVVPVLALLGGLPMPVAVGSSLIVIAMKWLSGQRCDRLGRGWRCHRRRARRWTDRCAPERPGQSGHAAKSVRLVRVGHVVGHCWPGSACRCGYRRRGCDRARRRDHARVHEIPPVPVTPDRRQPTRRRRGLTGHIPPRVPWAEV